ncbi:transcriptional regulator [Rhizobium sophoriradicis]|uniref:helix-turn-helix transcriptional regulator n=1 Tax=Rhizobium sophoriradicis TaxID=1535245 RepID=UPI000BBDAA60|nr:YafY family protein [Rhizobium sophoriradicis]PCK84781.1 transcriptional regulator [Rhizobium sophoriradicis]
MRKADRLFQIIQILRRTNRPVTAAAIAEEIEVSRRSVYRDITDLIGQGVPIVGEAGFGYVLDPGYDMPPLMLTPDEIEAIVLGTQWVATRGDKALSAAAQDVLSKIADVIPERLRPYIAEPSVGAKPGRIAPTDMVDSNELRRAIREDQKLRLRYRSDTGEGTERIVWPIILGYGEATRLIVAWCELRQDFRHFRTDRMIEIEVLEATNGLRKGDLRRRWDRWREEQRSRSDH